MIREMNAVTKTVIHEYILSTIEMRLKIKLTKPVNIATINRSITTK